MIKYRLSKDETFKRFRKTHGKKFEYSSFKLKSFSKDKSYIKCVKHNKRIFISAHDHLRFKYGGCQKCESDQKSLKQRMSLEEFILKANEIHNYKYDYSFVHQFKNQHEKIEIICPQHGKFIKEAANHVHKKQKQGCPKCGEIRGRKKRSLGLEKFIKNSKKIHNNFYNYSLVKYSTDRSIVEIVCPNHGLFEQVARNHLDGYGCKECGKIKSGNTSRRSSAKLFISKSKKVHGKKFDYSKLKWINSDTPVEIICKKCGPFWIIPHNHTSPSLKRGCTTCGKKMRIKQNLWLDYLGIPKSKEFREVTIKINGINFKPDGYDKKNKTVYEFNGDYWHGNPKRFKSRSLNPTIGVTFGFLYKKTLEKRKLFKKAGYKIVSIWESDWDKQSLKLLKS